jgi:hypothetical protein
MAAFNKIFNKIFSPNGPICELNLLAAERRYAGGSHGIV